MQNSTPEKPSASIKETIENGGVLQFKVETPLDEKLKENREKTLEETQKQLAALMLELSNKAA